MWKKFFEKKKRRKTFVLLEDNQTMSQCLVKSKNTDKIP